MIDTIVVVMLRDAIFRVARGALRLRYLMRRHTCFVLSQFRSFAMSIRYDFLFFLLPCSFDASHYAFFTRHCRLMLASAAMPFDAILFC